MKINLQGIPYTQVANTILHDSYLSWKAKGIFAYIYSKPDGWDFSTERMQKDATDGLDSLYTGIKDLESSGYLVRKKLATGKVEYSLFHNPRQGKSQAGKNTGIINKERIERKKEKKDIVSPTANTPVKKDPKDPLPVLSEVVDYLDKSKQRHIGIIALYLDYRKGHLAQNLKTFGQLTAFISRHSKAAVKLKAWDDSQLLRAFKEVEKNYKDIDWTMETVFKHLTK